MLMSVPTFFVQNVQVVFLPVENMNAVITTPMSVYVLTALQAVQGTAQVSRCTYDELISSDVTESR